MKKKSMITIAVLSVFVMIAIAVNWNGSFFQSLIAPSDPDEGKDPSVEAGATPEEDTYFDNARYTRTQSRDEALALLHSIVNDDSVPVPLSVYPLFYPWIPSRPSSDR